MILSPLISKGQAEEIFLNSRKTFFRKIKKKDVCHFRLELIHLPVYIFEANIKQQENLKTVEFSVDGLLGNVMFFAPIEQYFLDKTENKVIEFSLPLDEAEKLVVKHCKTLILQQGMRFHREASLLSVQFSKSIYYPFWIAYFKKGKKYDFKAFDGISGEIQGIRMRKVFLKAFRG